MNTTFPWITGRLETTGHYVTFWSAFKEKFPRHYAPQRTSKGSCPLDVREVWHPLNTNFKRSLREWFKTTVHSESKNNYLHRCWMWSHVFLDYGRRANAIKIMYTKISGGRNRASFESTGKHWMRRSLTVCVLSHMVISWWKERGSKRKPSSVLWRMNKRRLRSQAFICCTIDSSALLLISFNVKTSSSSRTVCCLWCPSPHCKMQMRNFCQRPSAFAWYRH